MTEHLSFPFEDPLFKVAPTLKEAVFPTLSGYNHAEALQACFEALTIMSNTHEKPSLDPLATTLGDVVLKMAESCGFIAREINVHRIDLTTESNPAIIFAKETLMPALIYYKNSLPYLYEPVSGVNQQLENEMLEGYEQLGSLLYKQWPQDTVTIPQVAKAAYQESRSELRRFFYLQGAMALVMLLQPVLTGVIFDHIVKLRQYSLIDQVFLGLVVILLGTAAFKVVQNYSMMRFQAKSSNFLQSAIWRRLLNFNSNFFKLLRLGDLHERVMTVDHIQKELTTATVSALSQGIFSVAVLIFISFYIPMLGIFVFMVTVAFAGVSYLIIRKVVAHHRANIQTQARLLSFLFEAIRSVIKLKTSNSQQRVFSRWLNMELSKMSHYLRAQYLVVYAHVFQFVVPLLVTMALFFFMVNNDPFGQAAPVLTVGAFITVQMALGQYFGALMGMLGVVDRLLNLVPQVERARPILREVPEQGSERRIQTLLKGKITFQNVSFRYDLNGPLAIDNVSFTIEPGDWVAIVGPSGAGKSTLVRLILGLETPERGTILLDDIPLQQLDMPTIRRQVATVLQHTQLLPGSVMDNMRASNPAITEEQMWSLLRYVALYDDIKSMPMGLYTIIMGDGRTFSMGQRQRLVLARCLAKPLSMILLDEATSSLDNYSQEVILNTLSDINATRVMIAHRPSSIHRAKKIIALENGRIVS